MKSVFKVAIVGGGYSGLILATALKKKILSETVIFEKTDRLGKKILSTGNGRGNLTNKIVSVENYHGEDPQFAEYALERYPQGAVKSFFSELGLMFVEDEGRIYPASLQANSISDALRYKLSLTEVAVELSCEVTDVDYDDTRRLFKLITPDKTVYCETLVLAFGGCSQKQFGTDGRSFRLARKLGHTVTDLKPSLVQMRASASLIKGLKGVKAQVRAYVFDGDKEIKQTMGDILFTDGGISGNTVFNLSSYISGLKKPSVKVEFVPEISEKRLIDHLLYKKSLYPDLEATEILGGIVHKQIGKNIVKSATQKRTSGALDESDVRRIVQTVKSLNIPIDGTLGFDYSQVTHGGIRTGEIDEKTFESKIVKGLYFTGEAIDVDGDCGGYNMQWAFSSAMCVAENLNGKIK